MTAPVATATLDTILALQLTVAWAGEGRCEPKRLGWWQTDLLDVAGGGDFLKRLLPRTYAWAGLEAVREAARRADAQARRAMADPDRVRSLFFWGFEMDERLGERLGTLKRDGVPAAQALPLPVALDAPFSPESLAKALAGPAAEAVPYTVVPGARQLKGTLPTAPELIARGLAAGLVPFADRYPLPFYRVMA